MRNRFGRLASTHSPQHVRGSHEGFGELFLYYVGPVQHGDQQRCAGRLNSEQGADVAAQRRTWPQLHQAVWPARLAKRPLHLAAAASLATSFLNFLNTGGAKDILRSQEYTPCVDRGQSLIGTLCP